MEESKIVKYAEARTHFIDCAMHRARQYQSLEPIEGRRSMLCDTLTHAGELLSIVALKQYLNHMCSVVLSPAGKSAC